MSNTSNALSDLNVDWFWCIERLDKFIASTEILGERVSSLIIDHWEIQQRGGRLPNLDTRRTVSSLDEIEAQLPVVQKIFAIMKLDKVVIDSSEHFVMISSFRSLAIRAKALIENDQEIQKRLGDTSPQITAQQLHPWVWESAKSRWNTKHYADSVNEVGRRIKDELENQANRHLGESEQQLFNSVFGDKSTVTWEDLTIEKDQAQRRRAIRGLAEGFYAGVRNTIAHKSGQELNEQVALEWFAVASLIAHWIEKGHY